MCVRSGENMFSCGAPEKNITTVVNGCVEHPEVCCGELFFMLAILSCLIKTLKIKIAQVHGIISAQQKKGRKIVKIRTLSEQNLISFDEWSCS